MSADKSTEMQIAEMTYSALALVVGSLSGILERRGIISRKEWAAELDSIARACPELPGSILIPIWAQGMRYGYDREHPPAWRPEIIDGGGGVTPVA